MSEKLCEEFSDEIKKFREWIEERKIIPKKLSSILLLRYLKVCDYDIEKAGELLQHNLEFRAKFPQIFSNRDLSSEEVQQAIKTFQISSMLTLTPEKHHITYSRLIDEDSSHFDLVNILKLFFIIADSDINDDHLYGIPDGEIGVLDFKGFSWWHVMKIVGNITTMKTFMKFIQEYVPHKIIDSHYINCSPIITRIFAIISPFIKKELMGTMHFHSSGYESLYEFIPREYLPEEYGGSGGSLDQLSQHRLERAKIQDQKIKLYSDEYHKILTED